MSKVSKFGEVISGAGNILKCLECNKTGYANPGSPTHTNYMDTLVAKANGLPAGGSIVPNLNGGAVDIER